MRQIAFKYHKADGEVKDYEVMVLKEDASFIEGISIHDLSVEDRTEVVKIFKEFESRLEPFMKNYRRYNTSNIKEIYQDSKITIKEKK